MYLVFSFLFFPLGRNVSCVFVKTEERHLVVDLIPAPPPGSRLESFQLEIWRQVAVQASHPAQKAFVNVGIVHLGVSRFAVGFEGRMDDGEVSGDAGPARRTCLSGAFAVAVTLEISPESRGLTELSRPRHGPSRRQLPSELLWLVK